MNNDRIYRLSVEINLVNHCNLVCQDCDHLSPWAPEKFIDPAEFEKDLQSLSKVMYLKELQLLGGEPLLHPELREVVKIARKADFFNQLVLVTNGVLLHRMDPDIFSKIDGLWISIYPGVPQRYDQDWLEKMSQTHNVWIWKKATPKFFRKRLNQPNNDDRLLQYIYNGCLETHVYSCHMLHEARYYKCPYSIFLADKLKKQGINFDNRQIDSVPIHGNENLKEDLNNFISSDRPLAACRYCLGSLGPEVHHKIVNRDDLMKEMEDEMHTRITQLIRSEFILPPMIDRHSVKQEDARKRMK